MMIRAGLLTLVVGLVGAQAAWAAPARTITVGAANPFVQFDGGMIVNMNAVPGEPTQYAGRDDTLIKVESPGRLAITSTSDGLPTSEIDLELFRSDEAGVRGGEVAQGITDGPVESIAANVKLGYYLLSASGYPAATMSYKGEVKLTVAGAPPAIVVPATPVTPAPQAKPVAQKKKLSCKQKARRLKSAKKRRAALRRCAKRKR